MKQPAENVQGASYSIKVAHKFSTFNWQKTDQIFIKP